MSKTLITVIAALFLLSARGELRAANINVPNASFESPDALFGPQPNFNSWQKTPKPDWYDEGDAQFLWTQLTGIFKNHPRSLSEELLSERKADNDLDEADRL